MCVRSHLRAVMHRGITWDEQTIAEHDLLRGTRMKIEEPKTPYEKTVLSGTECSLSAMLHCRANSAPAPLVRAQMTTKI